MNLDLNERSALVCGSSQGIGKAAAIELAKLGCRVTLCARSKEKLELVADQLKKISSLDHDMIVADFSKPDQLKEALDRYLDGGRQFHILVNNTGGPPGGSAHQADIDEYRIAFNNHLICNQILVQALLPSMKRAEFGRIVNVISTSVKQPLDGLGVSNTIRGAVANWSKTLANELGPFGVTVNNVLPGATRTERLSSIIENKSTKTGLSQDEVSTQMSAAIPLRRFAEAEEVAAAIAFLCSPSGGYINGINLPVDGGRTKSL
jgi:3-oxoacyl-[acyl-carrier protein] reductase